jgi:tyrosyl-DNA phosphodiesterase-1
VQVKIVHGSWKAEDRNRIRIEEAAKRYANVQAITAYMPEAFGTHHSKMLILFRHDDTAQVIIHTANMISRDWTNMCQAVWRSPLLPLITSEASSKQPETRDVTTGRIGTGQRFKADLLRYLQAYQGKTKALVELLKQYDFGSIRAALIASTPSRVRVNSSSMASPKTTSWGWPGLKEILKVIPSSSDKTSVVPSIVLQTSSIATLSEKWITNFCDVLASGNTSSSTFFSGSSKHNGKASISIIFPTADEIRRSLDGYEAGASIHTKIQSAAQIKQVNSLRPMLCYWAGDGIDFEERKLAARRQALRRRAAPHIKTYIRFSSESQTEIDWALVTSANLSQQAWGALPDKEGSVRICSYEIGVAVWPALFPNEGEKMKMVPVFGKDMPSDEDSPGDGEEVSNSVETNGDVDTRKSIVGFRMPYDLPLVPYHATEVPWCATLNHSEPDWKGVVYGGFEEH